MSKRDMRAKKLLAAVLMALSMQVWYAPPIWAAEGGQTAKQTDTVTEEEQADATTAPAAGDSAKQETADAEAADTEQDAAANIKVPSAPTVRGYSISTLAAGDDYGIMPLAAGTNAYEAGGGDASGAYSVAIGSNTHAFGDYSIVLGSSAGAHAANSVAIGNESKAIKEYQVSFGDVEMNRTDTYHSLAGITDIDMIGKLNGANFTVDSHLSSIAIGTSAAATGARSTAFGYAAKAQGDYSLAFGYGATAANVDSIAIGGDSTTNADKQVSFGKYNIDTNSWSLTHSLAGIKDIEMTGELKGVTSINGKSIDSLGGGSVDLTNIETDINVKAVAKDGPLYNFSVERATGNITTAGTINGANFTVGDVTSKNIAVGIGATANLGSSAFGYNAKATGMEGSAFGNGATTGSSGSAFGNEANATGNYSSAFGDHAQATHEDSVAIGFWSTTTDTKQVSFGIGNVNADDGAVTWTKRRSLAGISAIDMEGALTGVTTINGANFTVDTANNSMAIGVGAVFSIDDLDFVTERSTVVGANAKAYDNDITLFGYDTYADYPGGVAFGSGALAESADAIAIGYQATASGTGSVAIGANSTNSTATENQVSFGTMGTTSTYRSLAGINNIDMTGKLNIGGTELYVTETGDMVFTNAGNKNIATGTGENAVFGYEVTVGDMSANTLFGNYAETNKEGATAIGFGAESKGEYSVALGALSNTSADYATTLGANSVAKNENSVAIGHESTTSAANQVSFGHKATDTDREGNAWGTELRRSLAGIKDIDMDGELKGVTKINGANFTVDTAKNSMAIGVGAATAHENSVAIGHGSITTEANQVSFGEGTVDPSTGVVTWSNIRNLAGIHDIAMEGALKGVTTINNAYFYVDESKKNMAVATGMFSGNNMTAFGDAINVSADYSSVFGSEATVTAKNSSAFGYKATATHDNSVAIGANSSTNAANQVSFGQISDTTTYRSLAGISDIDMEGALTGVTTINGANFTVDAAGGITAVGVGATAKWQGTAFGYNAQATGSINSTAVGHTAKALDVAGTAVGFSAIANGSNSTALGADTVAVNDYSVAIGYGSRATANNQVSFGDLLNNDTTTYRSLAGIKDITTIGALSTANGNFTVDASGNITKSGTINGATIAATKFNGVTIGTAGIGGINTFNGVMITPTNGITGTSIFNGVTLEKDASNHYKVGGVDVTQLETKTGGISRSGTLTGTDTGTTTIEGNTSISKAGGVATNKVTVSGGTTTTLENGKLTVGAATVQNTGFAVGSSSLANGSLTVGTGNTWTTAAGITATKGTIGGVTLSGNKVSGLTDATLSTNSTEAVTGKQLNATNQKVASAETDISTLQGKTTNISYVSGTGTTVDGVVIKAGAMTGVKSIDGIAVDSTTRNITNAGTYNGATIASSSFNGVTIGSGLVDGIDVSAMDTAYKAADKALQDRATALEGNTTNIKYASATGTTVDGVVIKAGAMTGVKSIDGIAIDSTSRNITNAGTYNGATIASSSFNGVTIGSGLVDGIDVSAMDTAYKAADKALQDRATTLETKTGGVSRSGILTGTDTGTTTIEGSTSISKAGGVATNKVTVSGATTTTLENGKLTVGAATVQNIGFSIGNSSLNGGALTLDTDNVWRTTTGITATKGTIGGVTLSGNDITLSGKVDGVDVSELAKQVGSGSTDTGTIAANTGGVTRSGILTGTDTGTTTIEGNTSISKDSGVTTNKVTVGAAVADQTIIDKGSVTAKTVTTGKSELSDSGLIVDTKTKVQSGLVQADATHKLDTAGLTVGTNTLTDTALTVGKFSVTAADGSLSAANGGFKVGGDGNLSIGSGKFTVAADGAVTGGTYNDVAINKKGGSGSDVMVGGINLTQLSSSTGTNLGGIERAADADAGGKHITTVEGQLSVYETGKIANTDNKFVVDGDKVTVGAAAADQTVIEKGSVTAKIVTVGKSELSDSGLAVDTKTKVQSGLVQADAAHKLDTAGLTVGTNTLTDTALTIGGTEIVDKQVKVGQNTLTDTALTIGTSVVTDGQLQVDGKSKMTKDGFIVSDTADSETQLTADSLILNGQELTSANIEGLNKVTLDGDDVKIGAGFKVNKDDGSFSAAGGNFAVAADGAATIGAAGTQTVIANDKVTVGSAAADQTVIDKGSVTTGSSKLDAEGLHVGDATSGDSYGYLTNNGVLNIFSKEYSKSHLTGDGAYIDKTIINGNTIRTGALEVDRLTVNGQVYTGHVSDGHLQFGNDGSIVNNIYDKKADGSKYITHFQTNVNDGTEGDLSKWGENKGVMMAVFDKEGATEDTIADMTFKDSTTGAYLGVQENGLQTVVKNQWNAKEGDVSGESATSGQRLLLTQSHDGQVIHVEDRDNDTGSVVETGSTVFRVSGIEKMGSETAADTLQEYFAVDTTSGIVSFSVAGSDGTALQTTIKGNAITTGMVNGVTIAAGDDAIKFGIDGVADSVVNVTEMSQRLANLEGTIGEDGTVKALNTVGIEHGGSVGTANSTTTIEGSTVIKESGVAIKGSLAVNGVSTFGTAADGTTTIKNNIITTGTVNADSFEQGGKALDQVFAAKDYVSGELKTVSDGLNDVNTALADKVGSADFTNLSNTVTGLGSTVTELDGRTTAVKYTGGVTSIGDVGISGSNVELGSINGIGIAKADGDTNLTIGGVKLSELGGNTNAIKGLQQDVKDIQDALTNPDGSKPEISIELSNTKGITREIQNAGAADEYGVTTIETNTRISQFGLTTNVLTAGEGSIGGVKFAGGKVSGVSAINGVGVAGDAVSNLTIGDVKLSDVNTLKKDVEELKKNGTGGSGTAVETENVKGIKRNGVSGDYGTTTIEGSLAVSRDGAALTGSLNVSGDAAFGSGSSQTTIAGSSIVTGTVNATTELKEQGVSLNEKYAAKGAYDDAFKDMNAALVDKAEQSDMTIVQNRLDRWDSSLSGWDSKLAGVTASTTNISYDKATGVTSVSGVGFSGNGLMSGVTELNGVAIGSHNDNLSIGGVNLSELGGMSGDVSSLGNRVTDLEANAKWTEGGVPVVLDHTKGLTRKVDTYEDDGTTAKTFTTTIEGNTAISQSGIVTNNITAAAGSVGGVVFKSGAVSGVASLNGVTVSGNAASGLTIGGVSLSGLDTDVDTLQKDVEDLKKNGTGGGTAVETANVKGIKRTGVSGDYGTTTIEGSTVIDKDGARITGTLKATGAVTLGSGGEVVNISGGEVTASGSINAAGGLKEYGVKLEDKYLQGGDVYTRSQTYNQTEIDDMTGKLQREKASLTSVTELGDQVGVLTDKTAGISFSSGVTTIGSVNVSGSNISGVSDLGVASINGVGISKAEGDNNLTIGGVSLSKLGYLSTDITGIKGDIKDLQNAAFGSDTVIEMSNTKGIVRDTTTAGSEVTTIEGNTHISKNGLQTSSLQADKATIGGVNIAGGAITGATFNGAVISGSKFNGIDVGALQSSVSQLGDRVTKIETEGAPGGSGGGSSENTAGIKRPGSGETTIETNTTITGSGVTTNNITAGDSITVAGTSENKTTIDKDGIVVAEGQTNQVTINKDGIHVGANSSVVNDVDGFITDKGLYIGVSSSGNTDSAKFSVDKSSGTMTSKVGDYTFTNGSGGAVFKNSGSSAKEYGESSTAPKYTDTSIKGNEIHTGQLNANELILDGSKVNVEHKGNSDILADQAINNTVKGSGDNATHFETNGDGGVTSEVTDGKNTVVNNTNASGTSITKYKVGKDSDGNATRTEVGRTDINGDSLTVSKMSTTTEKDADGNEKEVTKTVSSTTVGSGEVTLHREDGSTIRVGEAIEGMQDQIQDIGSKVNEMGVEIKEVGALSAALAGLHPQPENANSRADFAMAMGSYEGKQALAVGGFYRPDKRTMLSIGASTTSSKHMMNMGISIALDKLPEAERKEQESNTDLAARMKKLEAEYEARLEKMEAAYEARMERLEARYARLQEAAASEQPAVKTEPVPTADQAAEMRKAEAAKKAAEAEKVAAAKKAEEVKKAEEAKKAEELKKAEAAKKAAEAEKVAAAKKAAEVKKAEEAKKAEEVKKAEAAKKAAEAEKIAAAKKAAEVKKAEEAKKAEELKKAETAKKVVKAKPAAGEQKAAAAAKPQQAAAERSAGVSVLNRDFSYGGRDSSVRTK